MKIYSKCINRANFRKILSKYRDVPIPELIENIQDISDIYNMDDCIKNIDDMELVIKIMIMSLDDSSIRKFVSGLSTSEVDFNRFNQWKEFRKNNKCESISEEYFKVKYGNTWEFHKNKKMQNRTNPYDVNDVAKKHNCSLEQASLMVADLKTKTSPSIEKYGEERFKYVTRRHKNYIDYWVKKHNGDLELAHQSWNQYKKTSSCRSPEHWKNKGYGEEDAQEISKELQLLGSGVFKEYYHNKGLSPEETQLILDDINSRKDSSSLDFIRNRYSDLDDDAIQQLYKDRCSKKSSYYREHGILIKDREDIEIIEDYYRQVHAFTNESIRRMEKCPGNRGKGKNDYHIDHIFSIKQGWIDSVPAKIIGSVVNLRWMNASENCSKKADCHYTLEELYEYYKEREDEG